jgi:hypothetical protein
MILQVPYLPFTLFLFVPGSQTQAAVGDAKPISQLTNGFGFLIRDLYTKIPTIFSFGFKDFNSELSK